MTKIAQIHFDRVGIFNQNMKSPSGAFVCLTGLRQFFHLPKRVKELWLTAHDCPGRDRPRVDRPAVRLDCGMAVKVDNYREELVPGLIVELNAIWHKTDHFYLQVEYR